jgi:hypothetical protein
VLIDPWRLHLALVLLRRYLQGRRLVRPVNREALVLTVLLALSCRCGGQTTASTAPAPADDGRPMLDASTLVDADRPERTGSGPDSEAPKPPFRFHDAAPLRKDYVKLDGGHACDGGAPRPEVNELRTCCNGVGCNGNCLLFQGATAPVCICAGVDGGCPGGWACCGGGASCLPPENCKFRDPGN